jgi:WD40 repeat protein
MWSCAEDVPLYGHTKWARRIVPLPGGEFIATSCDDGEVRVFDAACGAMLRDFTWRGYLRNVPTRGLAALGSDLVVSGDSLGLLCVRNVRTGEFMHTCDLRNYIGAVAALDAGRFLASTSDHLFVFEHRNGHGVTEARKVPTGHAKVVADIAVCGGRFATASWDTTAAVWDAATFERLAVLDGHTHSVHSVAMDEQWIVTGSMDFSVRVHDARTFTCVRVLDDLHTETVSSVAIIGLDQLLSASHDCTVCLSDLNSGALIARLKPNGLLFSAAVTRDGRIATAGVRGAALHPPPDEAAHVLLHHKLALNVAARPAFTVKGLRAIETGTDPRLLHSALAGRRE